MKILVISLAGIGDSLLASPLLRGLREAYPDARIDALVMWGGTSRRLLAVFDLQSLKIRAFIKPD